MKAAFKVLMMMVLALMAGASHAQNLLEGHNCNFQTSNVSWLDNDPVITTQYIYTTEYHGLQSGGEQNGSGKMIVTGNANTANGGYWTCAGHNTGKFLAVNGYGGNKTYYEQWNNTPSNKKIIQYSLQVQPNMFYDFTFWATHLTNGDNTGLSIGYFNGRVKFRVQSNGSNVTGDGGETNWEPEYVQNQPNWDQSPVYRCLSNANGQLTITLYDDCVWSSEYGDDFGIDDASLVLAPYDVYAHFIDGIYGCNGSFDPIDVLSHVDFTHPVGQPALPATIKIRRSASAEWAGVGTVINTYHGTAYVGADSLVHYTPDPGYVGVDQLQYQVEKFGKSDWSNVNINVIAAPSGFVISGFPSDSHWCKGEPFQFSCTCQDNGAPLWGTLWEWTEAIGQPWHELVFSNFPTSSSCHDYYVRYKAENACGVSYSDTLLLSICDDPVLNKNTITAPNTICEGGALPNDYLTQVHVSDWKNDIGTEGWQVKHGNGAWVPLGNGTLAQGDKLRYRAVNYCGEVVTNEVTVSVTAGPEFTEFTPTLGTYFCVGDLLELSSQTPPAYQSNGISITEQYWARSTDEGMTYSRIYGNPTLDMSWDGNRICYQLVCPCGTVNSSAPFVLHVYGEPEFSQPNDWNEGPYCDDESILVFAESFPLCSGSPDMTLEWQISSGTTQSGFTPISLSPNNWFTYHREDDGKWIRCFASSSCGTSATEAVQIHVYDEPVLNTMNLEAPQAICSGGSLPASFLNQVHVDNWNGDIGVSCWYIKHPGGDWDSLTSQTVLQNGDQLQFYAGNYCGGTFTNTVTISVADGPTLQSTPAFEAYYCEGDQLTFPEAPGYDSNGLTVLPGSSYWAYSDEEGAAYTPINGTPTLTEEWNGRLIRYHLAYQCDGQVVYAYSPNPVALTVYGEPTLEVPEYYPTVLDTVCWGATLSEVLPEGFAPGEGSHFDVYGWEISNGPNSSEYIRVDDPATYLLPVTDDGCMVRFFVEGCGDPVTGDPLRLCVGNAPSLYPQSIDALPAEVCEGTSVGSLIQNGMLTEVSVDDWHYFDDPEDPDDPSYERWEVFCNGSWQPLSGFELAHNGCQIRYVAHNRCGTSEVVAPNTIAVVEGPSFTSPNEQLQFEDRYCVSDLLNLPPAPAYVDPYNNIIDAYWASSFDGLYYSAIGDQDPVLTDNWHGRYISYVLESNCGGVVVYSTPFQLYVVGTPEVLSATVEPSTLCEGELLTEAEVEVDWKNGTDEGSSWQYMDVTEPGHDFVDFNPLEDPLPPGSMMVRYRADNGCYEPGSSDMFMIEVTPLPHFTEEGPMDLPDYCEGSILTLPEAPSTEGYTEGSGVWQISVGTNQNGSYVDVTDTPLTAGDDGRWLKYSVTGCDGQPVSKYGEVHVLNLPTVEFDFETSICRGQLLNPQVVSVSDVEYVLWRCVDSNGNEVPFSPDTDAFETLGVFYVSWAPVNQCNQGNPEYCQPRVVEVVQGPEFLPAAWPNPLVVCSGMTLSEVMDANSIQEPNLLDPNYDPAPQPLGWFFKYKDEDNNWVYSPLSLNSTVTELNAGYELCYGMMGDCSTTPIYSTSVILQVKGRPEIVSVNMTTNFCAGESFPPADLEVELDAHNSGYIAQWQWLESGSWTNVPGSSFVIGNEHDGMQVRYTVTSSDCGFDPDASDPVTLYVSGVPEIEESLASSVGVCANGPLVIQEPLVNWHHTLPETGEWQVCATENGTFSTGPFGTEGLVFDMNQVDPLFDGWYLRYHVEGCGDENNSNATKITVFESSEVQITGTAQAAVMNSYWPGVYYYYTEVTGGLNWTLTPEIWPYHDTIIDGKSCCQVIVNQRGQATLTASVGDGSCGSDQFVINASAFGMDEHEALKMDLYPNPARNTVTVVSEAIESVVVYDLLGQRVKSIDGLGDDSISFSVEGLPEALYLVEVQTKKGNKTLLLSVL